VNGDEIMADKWLRDLCFIAHALLYSDAPREEISEGLRRVFAGVHFGDYATLREFTDAASKCPEVDQGCLVVAAVAYLFIETKMSREKIAGIFADAIEAIEELPEWPALQAELKGILSPPSGTAVAQ
jgi:hypothetical protein